LEKRLNRILFLAPQERDTKFGSEEISETSAEKPQEGPIVEISNISAEKTENCFNVEISNISAEKPNRSPSVEISRTSAEKPEQGSNMEILKTGAENFADKFSELHAKLLALQEVLAVGGFVRSYWKNYQGKRLGPYYRVVYWHDGRRRSLYLGSDPLLADHVVRLLENWQRDHREELYLRRLRAKIRASLRREKANLRKLLAPLGFRMKGFEFHRIKNREPNT
jgi:hypothetical protein